MGLRLPVSKIILQSPFCIEDKRMKIGVSELFAGCTKAFYFYGIFWMPFECFFDRHYYDLELDLKGAKVSVLLNGKETTREHERCPVTTGENQRQECHLHEEENKE